MLRLTENWITILVDSKLTILMNQDEAKSPETSEQTHLSHGCVDEPITNVGI